MAKFDHFNFISLIYDRVFGRSTDQRIVNLSKVESHHSLLDIGGGTGRVAISFFSLTPTIIIADSALRMLQQAKSKGLSAIQTQSETLPFPDSAFDRIIMVDAFHHVFDQRQSLDEIWRTLAPGGRLIIEEPDIQNFAVKLIALGEKILLMRSKFLKPTEIMMMCNFGDVAKCDLLTDKGIAWVIIDKNPHQNSKERSMSEINVAELMKSIPNHFNVEKAKGVSGVVQCLFSGEQASDWVITIENQTCTVEEGKTVNPNLTIKADAEDGVNLLTGKLDAMRAYMLGKVKVFGDLSLGMKLINFFDM